MPPVGDELHILLCDGFNVPSALTDAAGGDKRASVASIDNAEGVKEKVSICKVKITFK